MRPKPTTRAGGAGRRLRAAAALLALWLAAAPAAAQVELELLRALPVTGLDNAQPSGLCMVDGELYAVSDQHDHTICRLQLDERRARMEPYITFNAPWSGDWVRGLDFEGLAYRSGFFFIASESTYRVLRVHESGSELTWITPSVKKVGQQAGLFTLENAGVEGLALLDGGRLLLAAEREPRGLVEVVLDPEGGKARMTAFVFDETMVDQPAHRPVDFSDLLLHDGQLYGLSRNADAIIVLGYEPGRLDELEVWTFGHVTHAPEYRYDDMTYGKAEGLAMDGERVYVLIDNNSHPRAGDPTDTRPLLLIFRRP